MKSSGHNFPISTRKTNFLKYYKEDKKYKRHHFYCCCYHFSLEDSPSSDASVIHINYMNLLKINRLGDQRTQKLYILIRYIHQKND